MMNEERDGGWAETSPPGRSLSPDTHTTATLDLLKDKTEQPLEKKTRQDGPAIGCRGTVADLCHLFVVSV